MDAMLQQPEQVKEPSLVKVAAFLEKAMRCQRFDYRYEGFGIVGAALVSDDSVVHPALFRVDASEGDGWPPNYSTRWPRWRFRRG